ncbi:MAG: FkbM family methyltransferase [Bacteroidia bacterium]|nr:FkbM family methyltransferase [Bacteroidia bacterium]
MRWLYLVKILYDLPKLRRFVRSPLQSLWSILSGRDIHFIAMGGGRFLKRKMTAPNLYGFIHLRLSGVELAPQQPDASDQLLWQLSSTGTFLTRLTVGMDLMTLYELFGRKDYGEEFQGKIVVDVGAYNGDSAVFFALRGAQKVLALEPYPPNYALAEQNIQRMGLLDKIKLLPCALGPKRARSRFHVAPASPDANALEPPDSPLQKLIRYEHTQEVEVLALEDILAELGAESIDFLKMDCEGCEFSVLNQLSADSLRRVKVWHIEYHAKPDSLVQKLKEAGFVVRKEKDRRGLLGYLIAELSTGA